MTFISKALLIAAVTSKKTRRSRRASVLDREYNPYDNFDKSFTAEHIEDHERALLGLGPVMEKTVKGRRLMTDAGTDSSTNHTLCQTECAVNHKAFSEYWTDKEPAATHYFTTYSLNNANEHSVCKCKINQDQSTIDNLAWELVTLDINHVCTREYTDKLTEDVAAKRVEAGTNYRAADGSYADNIWLCEETKIHVFTNGAIKCNTSGAIDKEKKCISNDACFSAKNQYALFETLCSASGGSDDHSGGPPEECLCEEDLSASSRRMLLGPDNL